ncbi:MAG TPA: septal ring lytic transglycosylase RlpA family protein [Thermoanaerobaculia bacterium]|nr:septal ring lytic transglycosylase RlpA family protein [Thermoanaerobaculia bacterium]
MRSRLLCLLAVASWLVLAAALPALTGSRVPEPSAQSELTGGGHAACPEGRIAARRSVLRRTMAAARASSRPQPAVARVLEGRASYYHPSLEGNLTASGERYRGFELTAAHRELPFGTRLRVTNLRNGRSVVVRINDRGPFHPRRILDLSRAAARELGILFHGEVGVRVEVLE